MSQQFSTGTTFTNTSPGNVATVANMNAMVNAASALSGLVTTQPVKTARPNVSDAALIYDSQDNATPTPKQLLLGNLLPEVVANGSQQYSTGAFAGGNYTVDLTPAASAYTAGMTIKFLAASANTGAATVNVNGIGQQPLVNAGGGPLAAGQIPTGALVEAIYNGSAFQVVGLFGPDYGASVYSADAGTANAYVITLSTPPASYFAGMTIRFKAANTNTGTSGINVNALGSKNIIRPNGSNVVGNDILAGAMVQLSFDGTNFQLMNAKLGSHDFNTGPQTLPPAAGPQQLAVAHGLGAVPTRVRWVLRNVTGELGYSTGDEVDMASVLSANGQPQFVMAANATDVYLISWNTSAVKLYSKSNGTFTSITYGNWTAVAYVDL